MTASEKRLCSTCREFHNCNLTATPARPCWKPRIPTAEVEEWRRVAAAQAGLDNEHSREHEVCIAALTAERDAQSDCAQKQVMLYRKLEAERDDLKAQLAALREASASLIRCQVVDGLSARIRNNAKERGVPDEFATLKETLWPATPEGLDGADTNQAQGNEVASSLPKPAPADALTLTEDEAEWIVYNFGACEYGCRISRPCSGCRAMTKLRAILARRKAERREG